MADRYLLESGAPDGYLLEDGSGVLLLNQILAASTLTDNFDDNSTDTAKWVSQVWGDASTYSNATVSETGGKVQVTPPTASGSGSGGGYTSLDTFNITDDRAFVRIDPGTLADGQNCLFYVGTSNDQYYAWQFVPGANSTVAKLRNGFNLNIYSGGYSYTGPIWVSIRYQSSDSTWYFEIADASGASDPPTSGQWTLLGSRGSDFSPAAVKIGFGVFAPGSIATSRTQYFDGLNTATAAASGNNIVGSTSLTFAPSATLLGQGAVSGSSALTFAPTATLLGKGAVSGASSVTFTPSGALVGRIGGTLALSFAPSATLLGGGSVAGTSALTFSPAATLFGTGQVVGASSIAFSPGGTVLGRGAVVGSTSLTFSGSGTIVTPGTLAGTTALSLSLAGSLTGQGAIEGAAGIAFDASAVLQGISQISGSTLFSWMIAGQLATVRSFIIDPKPTAANLDTPPPAGETNVIGLHRPAKLSITTVSAADGAFTPAAKPPRAQWRT